jgi:tetratricopeptide (TPR) repeat protein
LEDELLSWSDHAMRYMLAAVRAFGADIWPERPAADSGQPEAVGGELFRLIFADRTRRAELGRQLAVLAGDPDDKAARDTFEGLISEAVDDDPAAANAAIETLAAFYRRQGEAGNPRALADLGDLLYWEDDVGGARAAYQLAIDGGWTEAFIGMADLHRRARDYATARACLDEAIKVGDAGLTAQALGTLALVLAEDGDADAAESALRRAIDTGHPDWAPAAMSSLGHSRARRGDPEGGRSAFRQAIDTGHREWASEARFSLAGLLTDEGDRPGAREQYQRLVEMAHEHWSSLAAEQLIPQLQEDGDVDGLRELHRTAAERNNWSAPEALVAVGHLLEQRGDTDGARAAFQQAIDDGYHGADDLIEKLSPSPEPTAAELDQLPPPFDPRNVVRTGLDVLSRGLPELPGQLSYLMAIPVACWTAQQSAVVLFMQFRRHGREYLPGVLHVTYTSTADGWTANRHFIGTGFSHDPIARPGSQRDLDGRAMVGGGGTQTVTHGRAAPAVTYLALIQDGREDARPLESHFGAWVICTDQASPFPVVGRDADGNVLARISYD